MQSFLQRLMLATNERAWSLSFAILICFTAYLFTKTIITDIYGAPIFTLFDDGMISMTYALNFVQGHGLVWRPGEWVEGYTNPLWTLIMAFNIFLWGKDFAALGVQGVGVMCLITFVYLAFHHIRKNTSHNVPILAAFLVFLIIMVAQYTLFYWALVGMEVALMAPVLLGLNMWVAQIWNRKLTLKDCIILSLLASIAYGLRMDGALLAAIPLIALSFRNLYIKNWRNLAKLFLVAVFCSLVIAAHMFWRFHAYGEWLPNTYTLKMVNIALEHRLDNGVSFIGSYFKWNWLLMCVAAYFAFKYGGVFGYLSILGWCMALIYQIYVGGDPWLMWRQITPNAALVWVAASGPLATYLWQNGYRTLRAKAFIFVCLLALFLSIKPYTKEVFNPSEKLFLYGGNQMNYRTYQALTELLPPSATVAVWWAGLIPYYWTGPAYDMLGKTNKEISRLNPNRHYPAWDHMEGVMGHNKYALELSIARVKPDYLQNIQWGDEGVGFLLNTQYYRTVRHGQELFLKRPPVKL